MALELKRNRSHTPRKGRRIKTVLRPFDMHTLFAVHIKDSYFLLSLAMYSSPRAPKSRATSEISECSIMGKYWLKQAAAITF